MKTKSFLTSLSLAALLVTGIGIGLHTQSLQAEETNTNTSFFQRMHNKFLSDEEKEEFENMTEEERQEYMEENHPMLNRGINNMKNKNKQGVWGVIESEDISSSVEYIDNGVKVTLESEDSETVDKMNDLAEKALEFHEERETEISLEIENIDNGLIIIITSDDEEEVTRIQDHAKRIELLKKIKESGIELSESINHEVTELDNGVQINITSDDEDVQELIKLQRHDGQFEGNGKGKGRMPW